MMSPVISPEIHACVAASNECVCAIVQLGWGGLMAAILTGGWMGLWGVDVGLEDAGEVCRPKFPKAAESPSESDL